MAEGTGNEKFQDFAGQEVAGGINTRTPVIPLEKKATLADIPSGDYGALMGMLGPTFYKPVKVFTNPLDPIFPKRGMEYGSGFQTVGLSMGPPNSKNNGTCMPRGGVIFNQQLNLINFSYKVDMNIKRQLLKKYCRNEDEFSNLLAMHMAAPAKTIATLRYNTMKQVVSDVIDGTRSVASTTISDNSGSTVTYDTAPDGVSGYVGKIDTGSFDIANPTIGGGPITVGEAEAFDIRDRLTNTIIDMGYESKIFTKKKGFTFSNDVRVIMAEKVLKGIDRALDTPKQTRPSRVQNLTEAMTEAGAGITKIDAFPDPPTNSAYSGAKIIAVIVDSQTFAETVTDAYSGSYVCIEDQRNEGFTFQGEGVFSAWEDSPSYALLQLPEALSPSEP